MPDKTDKNSEKYYEVNYTDESHESYYYEMTPEEFDEVDFGDEPCNNGCDSLSN